MAEQHRGTGNLYLDGEILASQVGYSIDESPTTITGQLEIDQALAAGIISRVTPESDLVLELQSGRRWPCLLANDNGDLLSRGPIS